MLPGLRGPAVAHEATQAPPPRRRLLLILLFLCAGWALTVAVGGPARAEAVPPTQPPQAAVVTPPGLLPDPTLPLPPPTEGLSVPPVIGEVLLPTVPALVDSVVVVTPPTDPGVVVPTVPPTPDPGTVLPVEVDPATAPADRGADLPPSEELLVEPVTMVADGAVAATSEVMAKAPATDAGSTLSVPAPLSVTSTTAPAPALQRDEASPEMPTVRAAGSTWSSPAVEEAAQRASSPAPTPTPTRQPLPLDPPAAPEYPPLPSPPPPLAPAPATSTTPANSGAHGDTEAAILPGAFVFPAALTGTVTGVADADQVLRQSFQPGTRPD